ncbi:serologically defined colon cancer antigen 8 homolog [Erpetoichthys calabaricus]|uniref:serologically defined colon cancer antigen 8 homolog n=1 Tax=Erpetoichthys calabaricus TaxID=27687 RepID=UPI0022346F55|nr:serologically defined colon cancer antigen 8 homolog [Erpetoichthys calabaricus]
MKQTLTVVMLEKEKLNEELKTRTFGDTLKDFTIFDTSTNLCETRITGDSSSASPETKQLSSSQAPPSIYSIAQVTKWQMEMEKVNLLYQAKAEAFEEQTLSLRKELSASQQESEDLKEKLRHQESLIALSQHEIELAQAHANVHLQAKERLTKERDELIIMLTSLRTELDEFQQRELSAYQQVKQAVEMAEEANLEKVKAMVQCELLRSEIERKKNELKKVLAAEQEKIAKVRDKTKDEMKREKQNMETTLMILSEKVMRLKSQTEKLNREKEFMTSQLDDAQKSSESQNENLTKVCGDLRQQLNHLQLERSGAEKELLESRTKHMRDLELRDQEIEELCLEIGKLKKRLECAQQDVVQAKEESLQLTELLDRSEHQLHVTRQEKKAAVQSYSDEIKVLTFQAQLREHELLQKIHQMQEHHNRSIKEVEAVLSSQSELIIKMKGETKRLLLLLEQVTDKNRSETGELSQENIQLKQVLKKYQKDVEEMRIQHRE